jgi:hypothetical protein
MRSGRRRSDERTRSDSDATRSLVRSAMRFGALHELAGILDQDDAVGGPRHFGEERVGERRLPARGAAGNQDVAALGNGVTEEFGLFRPHDARAGVVCDSKDRDRWLADGEGRCGDDRRDQAFEAFSGLRQFGRKARRSGMHLGADMVGSTMRSPSSADSRFPVSLRPRVRRSIHGRPSGLSMISTMVGSSSQPVIVGPIAVRSMRTLREAASDLRETVSTAVPEVCDRLGSGQMPGTIKETQHRGKATTGIEACGYRGLKRTQRIVCCVMPTAIGTVLASASAAIAVLKIIMKMRIDISLRRQVDRRQAARLGPVDRSFRCRDCPQRSLRWPDWRSLSAPVAANTLSTDLFHMLRWREIRAEETMWVAEGTVRPA